MSSLQTYHALLIGGLLVASSILLSSLSNRLGIPILVIFLAIGMIVGSDGLGLIIFSDYQLAYFVSNLALAVILLDGGMRTRTESFRVALIPALSLATIGVFITTLLTGIIAMILFKLDLLQGLIIGSIIGSTDAAAIFSMLGNKGINERVAATLEIESGSNDPMAVFLTASLVDIVAKGDYSLSINILYNLFREISLGIAMGFLGGFALLFLINRVKLASGLYPLLALSGGISVFALTTMIHGSGILAIYLCGLVIGNRPIKNKFGTLQVFDGLAWLSQIGMFLVLGLLINPSDLIDIAIPALLLTLGIIFFARPIAVFVSLSPFKSFNRKERLFIAWVGLKGAVPIILAFYPTVAKLPNAQMFFNVAFFVVLVSLLLQGTSLSYIARLSRLIIPSTISPLSRIGIEIDAHSLWEQFIYKITSEEWCVGVPVRDLAMPEQARIAAIFRQDKLLPPHPNLRLKADDIICIIGKSQNLPALNKIFQDDSKTNLYEDNFFGDFILNADARMYDVMQVYGLNDLENEKTQMSLGDFMTDLLEKEPVVGDQTTWDGLIWTVAEIEQGKIKKVGIRAMDKQAPKYSRI